MTNRFIPVLFFTILSYTFSTYAAVFPVSGQVLNRNGNPINGANVKLANAGDETVTDVNGYFGEITPISNNIFSSANLSFLMKGNTLRFSNLPSNSNLKISINDLRGREIIRKDIRSGFSGEGQVNLLNKGTKIGNGLYIVNISGSGFKYNFKSIIKSGVFTTLSKSNNSITKSKRSARNSRAIDTLIITHSSYQTELIPINSYDDNINATLDPIGPDDIPVLYPDVSGKIYIRNSMGNITDTLKAYSVMPPAGIQEWSEVVEGRDPTGVIYDSVLTTSTTMKAHMIRAAMQDENDWQLSFATAIIGSTPFKKLSHIVIRYMVETSLDSIALSLNAISGSDVIAESADHGAFRKVLTKGVANPGEFVTDTLSMDEFTIAWSDDPSLDGISLGDNLDSLNNYAAIAFTNELNPWDETNNQPKNYGDTINITIAGILFGTQITTIDTITDTTDTTITVDYPIHRNITTSTFWCGEGASGDNDFITNTTSAWDVDWGARFGIEDEPFLSRDANFIPTSSSYTGQENPYYFALPYNDMGPGVYDGAGVEDYSASVDGYWRKDNSYNVVYWADEKSASEWGYSNSMCKNRWVRVNVSGDNKYCYAQWEDAGPYYYNDHEYVFGSASQANTTDSPYSGIDLSPSVCLYLDQPMQDWGAPSFEVDWCFVDEADVPDGPWKLHVTTTQINW